jgi:hypothetical protein
MAPSRADAEYRAMTNPAKYMLAGGVVFLPVDDGSARLLDLDGSFYALSASGTEMLEGTLVDGVETTIARIAARYEVSAHKVRSDLESLLGKLKDKRLIQDCGGRDGCRRRSALWPALTILPALRMLDVLRVKPKIKPTLLLVVARACLAMFGWARSVAIWQKAIRPAQAAVAQSQQDEIISRVDDSIRRAAARLALSTCKERALCAWYILRSMGIPAALVVGVQLYPLAGHCWCQAGTRILTDFRDRCETYLPVVRYE